MTGFEEVSKDHIDRVIFMSDPEQSTADVKTDPENMHQLIMVKSKKQIVMVQQMNGMKKETLWYS